MRASCFFAALFLTASAAAAAPVRLTIHNPTSLRREAAALEIPIVLLSRAMPGDWVAVANGEVAPLQMLKTKAVTVLDLPAEREIALLLRPREVGDPMPPNVARAVIPTKVRFGYRDVPSVVVPIWHAIHDPLFPIEGAGWESGRVGYRIYLDRRNAVDIYGKKQPAPILDRIGHPGQTSYHLDAPWGMDIWGVSDSLGAGGLGVLRGEMAEQVGPMARMVATVAASGPVFANLHVDADGWEYRGKPARLSADYTIMAGSRLSVVWASADVPIMVGFGKYPDTTVLRSKGGRAWGYIASWGRQSEDHRDLVGAALFYPVAEVTGQGDDGRSYFVAFKDSANAHYAFAGVWARDGQDIADIREFAAFVDRTAAALSNPLTITKAE